jgi:hypothetical protein
MALVCYKTGQKGTNAMFVMMHDEIMHALVAKKKPYTNPVIIFRPQKDDPHRTQIGAGGNLINNNGNASVRTVDLDTENCTGTVWITQKMQGTCALTKKN